MTGAAIILAWCALTIALVLRILWLERALRHRDDEVAWFASELHDAMNEHERLRAARAAPIPAPAPKRHIRPKRRAI